MNIRIPIALSWWFWTSGLLFAQSGIVGEYHLMDTGAFYLVHALTRDTLAQGPVHHHQFQAEIRTEVDPQVALPAMLLFLRHDHKFSQTLPVAIEDAMITIHVEEDGHVTYSGTRIQDSFHSFISRMNDLMLQLAEMEQGIPLDSIRNKLGFQVEQFYFENRMTKLRLMSALLVNDILSRRFIDPSTLPGLNRLCQGKGQIEVVDSVVCNALDSYSRQWTGISVLEFTAKGQDGGLMPLNTAIGKRPVILDFWASWCGPCIKEMPALKELYTEGEVEIIGISIDASENAWKKSLDKLQLPWINVWDEGSLIAKQYHVTSVPTKFVIDKDGIIVARNPENLRLVLDNLKE